MKLVTCGLPYANGKAHIGHLRTYIPADVYVRYLRLLGEDVLFICGSDCHGTPIVVNAEKEGISPKELVDRYHEHFQKVFKELEVEFDFYGRTDAEYNHRRTQEIVKKLMDKGYIYAKEIELAFCPKCDRFLPDRYVEGICPYCGAIARGDECDQGCGRHLEPGEILQPKCKICGNPAIFKKQKHYFFKLTAFKDFLMDYLENKLKGTSNALNYAREWVRRELKDWCITRNLEWGVKFPGENLVVYVWVDAPIGYISFTEQACKLRGCNWEEIWKSGEISDITHFIGLDIVYHHCIFWPAMLKGAGYSLPKAVVASGMVKVEGKTFSKSRGYVVWVEDDYLKAGFHPDYLRYYIVSYTSHEKDLNFSWRVFKDKVNNELIATLGNFIYRVLHFAWKNFGKVRMNVDKEILERISNVKDKIVKSLKVWEFKEICDAFMELATFGNEFFQSKKPWELIKTDRDECERVLANAIQLVKALLIFAYPVMPKSMENVAKTINLDLKNARIDDALKVDDVVELGKPKIPFEKVEDRKIEEMEKIMMERIRRAESGEKESENFVDIKDFAKLDIRIGRIIKAERIKGSRKLLRLEVDIGNEIRQIVAGIAETYNPEDLIGKLVPVLVNIKPAKLMGVESRGMILAVDVDGKAVLLHPDSDVPVGSKIR
ncbi:methionine--tRNA ligase [Archaeoglobus sp.]